MANEKNVLGTAESTEVFNDYEFSPVPDEKKNTWKSQIFVWLGVGFCLTAFTLGGQIALGLGFWPTVAAVFIGGIILTLVGILCGAIGVRSGLLPQYRPDSHSENMVQWCSELLLHCVIWDGLVISVLSLEAVSQVYSEWQQESK